eukprot:15343727-Ditylum_brightwellii.AAC.1
MEAGHLHVMVTPFNAYISRGDVVEHETCKKTIIVQRMTGQMLKWADQPFRELKVDDIAQISLPSPQANDDMLCLQVGSTVGAVVASNAKYSVQDTCLLSSNLTEHIVHQLKSGLVETTDLEFEVVNRKSIFVSGWYIPNSPEAKAKRFRDVDSGNSIWSYGVTRLINPYTTKFESTSTQPISALVIGSANALHLPMDYGYEPMKGHIGSLTNLVRTIDKPSIMLGIGIQSKFSDVNDTEFIKLHEHQVTFMDEIAKRNTGKSVSVRGEFTETACINAGVMNAISLGCPSLTISRNLDLGKDLETKWNKVAWHLAMGKYTMKIGIGLPAINPGNPQYGRIIDMLLSICEGHDCYFIAQMPEDRPNLLKYAQDKVDEEKLLHFWEDIESWFEFMSTLDFVVSTRIHGGMAGISSEIPTIIVPTDLRILELVNAMILPHISYEDAIEQNFTYLAELMVATNKDFNEFEINRRNRVKEYRRMLGSVGLEMDPALLDIIIDEKGADGLRG